jgi:RNA polymerase sigma-70 factor (ECF subfamily)
MGSIEKPHQRHDGASRPDDACQILLRLYEENHQRLLVMLRTRTGDPHLAEDLAHEALLRASRSIQPLDGADSTWPWVKAIAVNLAIDHMRRRAFEVPSEDVDRPDGSAQESAGAPLLDLALGALPSRQRVALSLRYLNGWSPLEAATFMGVSRATFDQLLCRGRRKLNIEYRRLRTRAHLAFLFPFRWARRAASDIQSRSIVATAGPGVGSASQLVGAAAATIIMAASPVPLPAPPAGHLDPALTAAVERPQQAPSKARHHDDKAPALREGSRESGREATREPAVIPPSPPGTGTPADAITDPNRHVDEPEDTTIGSIAIGDDRAHTIYAAGRATCTTPYCPPVLFRSSDRGATWERLPALGLQGTIIAVPPGHEDNGTIFAMGPEGLQISRDAGLSFLGLMPTGTSLTGGSLAVSPLYDRGDPLVLVGAQTLMRYSDASGTMDAYPQSLHGPFEPAFSWSYPQDPLFYLGGVREDGADGLRATVFTCHSLGCVHTSLPALKHAPELRTATQGDDELVYAFTETDLFVATAPELRFTRVTMPAAGGRLLDLRPVGPEGALIAAVGHVEGSSAHGIYLSRDGGETWKRSGGLGRLGTRWIAVSGDLVVAAPTGRGVICSSDGGSTFRRRCS